MIIKDLKQILIKICFVYFRGFSTVSLVEDSLTHKKYAIKKIICHGPEDQRLAVKEVEYHSIVKHPNVIELIDSTHQGTADPVVNATSEVLLVLPYYHVSNNLKQAITISLLAIPFIMYNYVF